MFTVFLVIIWLIDIVWIVWTLVVCFQSLFRWLGITCVFKHDFDGCKCRKCGKVRDSGHVYIRTMYGHETKNSPAYCKCGRVCKHPLVRNCRCQVCGAAVHSFKIYDDWWDDTRNMYKWRSRCRDCGKENYG